MEKPVNKAKGEGPREIEKRIHSLFAGKELVEIPLEQLLDSLPTLKEGIESMGRRSSSLLFPESASPEAPEEKLNRYKVHLLKILNAELKRIPEVCQLAKRTYYGRLATEKKLRNWARIVVAVFNGCALGGFFASLWGSTGPAVVAGGTVTLKELFEVFVSSIDSPGTVRSLDKFVELEIEVASLVRKIEVGQSLNFADFTDDEIKEMVAKGESLAAEAKRLDKEYNLNSSIFGETVSAK